MDSVIRNADQAMALLTHRRTGKLLPRLHLAKHTSLVYAGDLVAALTYWNAPIAWYVGDETVIEIAQWHHYGVSQRTRWRRINEFTVVRPFTQNGLRMVQHDKHNFPVLYEPKLRFDPMGECLNPMGLRRQRRITEAAKHWIQAIPEYAREAVGDWDDLTQPPSGCSVCEEREFVSDDRGYHFNTIEHLVDHIKRSQHVLPAPWRTLLDHRGHLHPDQAIDGVRKNFTEWMMLYVLPFVVEAADPERKYIFPHSRKTTLSHHLNAN